MGRGRVVIVAVKLSLLVAGLWVLFRPESPAPNAAFHEGQLLARAFGGTLLLLAAGPFRGPVRGVAEKSEEALSGNRSPLSCPESQSQTGTLPSPLSVAAIAFSSCTSRSTANSGTCLPGRAEPGEDLAAAACRETLEEAGIAIRASGNHRVEHSPRPVSTVSA